MICCFCGRHEEKDVAIEAGWVPAFWAHDKEWEGPVCVPCTTQHLFVNHDFEDLELQPGHDLPEPAIPLTKHPNLKQQDS